MTSETVRATLSTVKKLRLLFALLPLLTLAGLSSCSAPLVPQPRLSAEERHEVSDAELMVRLRADWELMGNPRLTAEEHMAAANRYNKNLLNLVRRVRYDGITAVKAGQNYEPKEFRFQHLLAMHGIALKDVFEDIVPAIDVRTQSLEEHYAVPGIGVPLVGIVPAKKVSKAGEVDTFFNIRTRGTVSTLTALLDFSSTKGELPVLRLIPRHRMETVQVGGMDYSLAGDFSAPLEVYWDLTRVREDRMLGMLRPQELRDITGLSSIEAYNPGRIPVILTHGLMSSAGTFDNLVNRLQADPVIRNNFQFWYYSYPTGVSWTITAAEYRKALRDVRNAVDPQHRNKNWDNMVVVGHSMGGLITHYSQCEQPWLMLKDNPALPRHKELYLHARYVDEPIPEPALEKLRDDYFFRPVKAGLVVYMATPHKGAPMARYRIVESLMKLVRLPEAIVDEVINVATLQEDMLLLNPEEITSWFTSVAQLSPLSYSIRGLQNLKVRDVPTHSIIGNRGDDCKPLHKTSDGVVPYWSSHIAWGTETVVPESHSVQVAPETAEDLARVLKEHLARHPREHRPVGGPARGVRRGCGRRGGGASS